MSHISVVLDCFIWKNVCYILIQYGSQGDGRYGGLLVQSVYALDLGLMDMGLRQGKDHSCMGISHLTLAVLLSAKKHIHVYVVV